MKTKTQKIVIAAMLAALTCVATMIIKIPSPLKGYMNLGDCVVLLSGWLLPTVYGSLAAGIGSALADLFSGYLIYTPATFIIKAVMAAAAGVCFHKLSVKTSPLPARILSGALAEILMIAGYLIFESLLYGFLPSLINVPANAVQGIAGLILGIILIKLFEKNNIF